jgi:two-component system CheB/CheR fusion protein
MLGLQFAELQDDVIHATERIDAVALRADIDTAFNGRTTATVHLTTDSAGGQRIGRHLRVTCVPGSSDQGPPAEATILVEDVTDLVQQREEVEAALERERTNARASEESRRVLEESNARLSLSNERLESLNLELLSSNEEFAIEEQQLIIAMEECQTLNQEMQATNAELEATSQELQMSVAELTRANQQLEVRGRQIQDMAESLDHQRRASETERARLSAVLLSVGDPIVVVDRTGAPVRANPAYDRTFGHGDGPFLALDASGRLLPAEEHPLRRAARGESFVLEFTTIGQDGTRRHCEATVEPVPDGGVERGVLVIRDVTERSIYRVQDEFLALASHELRTPLSAILIYLELLEQRTQSQEELEELHRFAERALHQAHRLKELTGDLLDATRLQHGKLALRMRAMDLSATVERAVEAAQAMPDAPRIALTQPPSPIGVHGDPSRLEQVVLNLLINAIANAKDTEAIDVRLQQLDPWAEIVVQDYGTGIRLEEIPFLFDRFRQVSRDRESTGEGLGLGLYIAREIMAAHGGTVQVESEPGQGATFTIRLPLAPPVELPPR